MAARAGDVVVAGAGVPEARTDLALDHARVVAIDAVERGRCAAGMVKNHLAVLRDVEAVPVHHRAVALLADRQRRPTSWVGLGVRVERGLAQARVIEEQRPCNHTAQHGQRASRQRAAHTRALSLGGHRRCSGQQPQAGQNPGAAVNPQRPYELPRNRRRGRRAGRGTAGREMADLHGNFYPGRVKQLKTQSCRWRAGALRPTAWCPGRAAARPGPAPR